MQVQAVEELEALGSDCARQLNRLRSRLPPSDKAALDALTSALGPAFDIEGGHSCPLVILSMLSSLP